MSTINHSKSSNRAISNASFVSQIMAKNYNLNSTMTPKEMLALLISEIDRDLKAAFVEKMPKPVPEIKPELISEISDPEVKEFLLTCCQLHEERKKGIVETDPSQEGTSRYYKIDPSALKSSVRFQIDCTSPWFRKAAKVLVGKGEIDDSMLYYCYAVGFLNRKWCLLGELLAKNNRKAPIFNNNNEPTSPLLVLWLECQIARSGSFTKPFFNKVVADKTVGDYMNDFEKAQASPMCPFNKNVHRRRRPSVDQNERYLLSLSAGANITQVSSDSTLGLVQRALGLPERCDISGTTTDAVGASMIFYFAPANKSFDTGIYILANVVSMLLQGHHSLDEMGASMSLSSDTAYNPLSPDTFLTLLQETPTRGKTQDRFQDASLIDSASWFTHEWLSLSDFIEVGGSEDTLKSWDFNDDNWRVWKMMARVMNRQPAP